jgi:hypothetical protein
MISELKLIAWTGKINKKELDGVGDDLAVNDAMRSSFNIYNVHSPHWTHTLELLHLFYLIYLFSWQ